MNIKKKLEKLSAEEISLIVNKAFEIINSGSTEKMDVLIRGLIR